MEIKLEDLFKVTIPDYKLAEGKNNFYMSFSSSGEPGILYKSSSGRPNVKLNLPPNERIILSPFGKKNGEQVGYVLIDTDKTGRSGDFETYDEKLVVGNNLTIPLDIENIKNILIFLEKSSSLSKLVETAVTSGKLKELIEAVVKIDNSPENQENPDKLLPQLVEAAVTARKFRNLIEEVVKIDNKPETQDKLLPKLIKAADTPEKLSKLIEADSRSYINYKQLIIYGPAGVGKTFSIKKLVSNNLENDGLNISEENFEKQTVHTVFHPEYSYYDFFGKVMPIKDGNSQISYDFLPGPFAQALSKAYKNITKQPINPEKVILVVDELNRGNAASIFGGLFNLLDRNDIGISEYPLNIYGMEAMWLKEQIGDYLSTLEKYSKKTKFEMYDEENKSLKIYIPDNLSIICTMNTSDQTIFSLDKAFQRRFNKNFITAQNSINEYFKDDNIKIETKDDNIKIETKDDKGIIWRYFLLNLNKFIVDHAEVEDVDNATIGAFFVKPKGGFILEEDIKYTVMYYLWYDLFSGYRRDTLKEELDKLDNLDNLDNLDKKFKNVNTFEQFVDKYDEFITKFTQNVATNEEDTTVAPTGNVQLNALSSL